MSKNKFIMTLVNIDSDRAYSVHLSILRLTVSFFILVVLFLTMSWGFSRWTTHQKMVNKLQVLETENRMMQETLTQWESKTRFIEAMMEGLKKQNQDIRIAAALPTFELGIGGPEKTPPVLVKSVPEMNLINVDINALETEVKQLHANMVDLKEAVKTREKQIAHYPSIKPVRGGWISSPFGNRTDPFTGQIERHEAIDISIKPGSNVFATGAGVVKKVTTKYIQKKGYGKYIVIDHGFGYKTLYAHLSTVFVKPGQKVKRWDLIGLSGNTGKSTAPHIHYEVVASGEAKNPMNYFLE